MLGTVERLKIQPKHQGQSCLCSFYTSVQAPDVVPVAGRAEAGDAESCSLHLLSAGVLWDHGSSWS